MDRNLFIELLPTQWRTVQHYGVEMNLVRYNGDALDGFRNRRSPWGSQQGKWRFKADPRDLSTVYFWRPEDIEDPDSPGEWAIVRRAGANGHVPFTKAELAYAKRNVAANGGNPRDSDQVAVAVEAVLKRTRGLNPATAEERRLTAKAILRDHQAARDRGEHVPRTWDPDVVPAGGMEGPDEPAWQRFSGMVHATRPGTDAYPPVEGTVDLDQVPILGTPDEIEFDPFELPADAALAGGYETVGDE